jgi:hypothetical protein
VIILSGTKNVLRDQTYSQVVSKLSRGVRAWRAISFDPDVDQSEFEPRLKTAMNKLEPRTLIVTILKRTRGPSPQRNASEGIDRLADFIEQSDIRQQISRQPVLIIDDEADEASLDNSANARRAGRGVQVTPTHNAIERLRGLFSRHLFVQYTATPQANLLVELSNELSPDFCELLKPGKGYCGAAEMFPPAERYFREISLADQQTVVAATPEPPSSLVEATHQFYVAAALEDFLAPKGRVAEARSMLVHPERTVASHQAARRWVQNIRNLLLEMLYKAVEKPEGRHAESVYALIRARLQDLRHTITFDSVDLAEVASLMLMRLEDTSIKMINSQQQLASGVDWEEEACWIFVGGDVLQRGFAIKGLTVSWVARSPGQGQVDVLMQRGRFFGYRANYIDYCRIWLPRLVHDDYYAKFADHEEALWRSLGAHIKTGKPLTSWSRVFWLDPNPDLRLCRRSIQWFRMMQQPEWARQEWIPQETDAAAIEQAATNSLLVSDLLMSVGDSDWDNPWPYAKTLAQTHKLAWKSVEDMRKFLEAYTFFAEDEVDLSVIRDALAVASSQEPDHRVALLKMRPDYADFVRRQRTGVPKIERLFGGRGKRDGQVDNYPGDSEFHAGGDGMPIWDVPAITLQIHTPRIVRLSDSRHLNGPDEYLRAGCPFIAVYIPDKFRQYRRERPGERR